MTDSEEVTTKSSQLERRRQRNWFARFSITVIVVATFDVNEYKPETELKHNLFKGIFFFLLLLLVVFRSYVSGLSYL